MVDVVPLPGARAVFSTRSGGVSDGPYRSLNLGILTDDDPVRVIENRRRLARAARVNAGRVVMGWQVHGAELCEWEAPDPAGAYAEPGGKQLPRVDGHLTGRRGLALLVLVADCYPVALSDGRRAAILHCGWRPLASGIIEEALARFGRMLGLRRVIHARLAGAGVHDVVHLDRCTSCHADLYFSHRRDDGLTGRQAGMVVLDGR